jgi:NitT/TauT family transport system permease protein
MRKVIKSLQVIAGFAILIAIWQVIFWTGGYNPMLFPPPAKVFESLIMMIADGSLWEHLQISMFRFLSGYLLAVVVAVLLGFILGRMARLWAIVDPIVQVLRPVAPIAWSPFIILWFQLGNASAIVIIFIAAFYPVLLTTVSAVKRVDATYLKIAANFELKPAQMIAKIILPAAFPNIVQGLRIALGAAWIFLVSGEMIGAQSGLGYLIVDGRNMLRFDFVLVAIIVIGLCGMILDRGIRLFERWVERQWGGESA